MAPSRFASKTDVKNPQLLPIGSNIVIKHSKKMRIGTLYAHSSGRCYSADMKAKSKKRPGLYANIHKAQERAKHGGRPVRKKGEPGAPTEAAFKKAKKTAKKKGE